jgi:hypothetical protein
VYAVLSLAKEMKPIANDPTRRQRNRQPSRNSENPENNRLTQQFVDRVYNKRKREYFPVEYSKTFNHIIDDLYNFATKQSGSLDLICRPWCLPVDDLELPSWVRWLSESPSRLDPKTGRVERVNADQLVALPGKSPYVATQNLNALTKLHKLPRNGPLHGVAQNWVTQQAFTIWLKSELHYQLTGGAVFRLELTRQMDWLMDLGLDIILLTNRRWDNEIRSWRDWCLVGRKERNTLDHYHYIFLVHEDI